MKLSVEQTLQDAGFESIDDFIDSAAAFDSCIPACCDCGAYVEPDGHCEHGNPSVLIVLGVI